MSRRGFTLVEVMAAVMILAIALVVLIGSQTRTINAVQRIQDYERGIFITENQLHWTYIDLNEADDWNEYADLSGEDGDYIWNVHIEPADTELDVDTDIVLLKVVATTRWPEGYGESSYELTTYYLWGEEM
ncbi:MAG: hypothetical protein CR997_08080 [Acidobacteria bacterium]|nr:MAG: hypothetical protein CR997_08080 [Acidobacteriota bacterium]